MVGTFKAAGVSLLLLFSTLVTSDSLEEEDEPQLQYNASLVLADSGTLSSRDWSGLALFNRDSYYTCPAGYSSCTADSSRCCPSTKRCCSNGYCASIGGKCCTIGTCPSGYNCCGTAGRCSPVGAQCCSDGYYCPAGKLCRVRNGRRVCCATSGCVGDYDAGDTGKTVTLEDVTSVTEAAAPTITRARYSYYYTTYYWTYWWYFWTTYYPYTAKTVTSTRTSTKTIWSAYETARSDARSSFSRSIESYTFTTPYSATYLKSSTDAVPLKTEATASSTAASATASNQAGDVGDFPGKPDAASGVFVNSGLVWTCAFVAIAIGGLAVGL